MGIIDTMRNFLSHKEPEVVEMGKFGLTKERYDMFVEQGKNKYGILTDVQYARIAESIDKEIEAKVAKYGAENLNKGYRIVEDPYVGAMKLENLVKPNIPLSLEQHQEFSDKMIERAKQDGIEVIPENELSDKPQCSWLHAQDAWVDTVENRQTISQFEAERNKLDPDKYDKISYGQGIKNAERDIAKYGIDAINKGYALVQDAITGGTRIEEIRENARLDTSFADLKFIPKEDLPKEVPWLENYKWLDTEENRAKLHAEPEATRDEKAKEDLERMARYGLSQKAYDFIKRTVPECDIEKNVRIAGLKTMEAGFTIGEGLCGEQRIESTYYYNITGNTLYTLYVSEESSKEAEEKSMEVGIKLIPKEEIPKCFDQAFGSDGIIDIEENRRIIDCYDKDRMFLTDQGYDELMSVFKGDKESLREVVQTYGAEACEKGYYAEFDQEVNATYITNIPEIGYYSSEWEAVQQAVADGVPLIPMNEVPESARFHYSYEDTEENREALKEYDREINGFSSLDAEGNIVAGESYNYEVEEQEPLHDEVEDYDRQ